MSALSAKIVEWDYELFDRASSLNNIRMFPFVTIG
jgi:hypothetical protein